MLWKKNHGWLNSIWQRHGAPEHHGRQMSHLQGPPPRFVLASSSSLPSGGTLATRPVAAIPAAGYPTAALAAAGVVPSTAAAPSAAAAALAAARAMPSAAAAAPSVAAAPSAAAAPSESTKKQLPLSDGKTIPFSSMFSMMLMSNAAMALKMPVLPSVPTLPGLPGAAARNSMRPLGPLHWIGAQARATSAAESLVEPDALLPQRAPQAAAQTAPPLWRVYRAIAPNG